MQKIQLTPLPSSVQSSPAVPLLTDIERKVKDALLDFLIVEQGRFPAKLRMSPCTVLEMPSSQWHVFHTIVYGQEIGIPVVADPGLKQGEFWLDPEGDEEATKAMEAVGAGC